MHFDQFLIAACSFHDNFMREVGQGIMDLNVNPGKLCFQNYSHRLHLKKVRECQLMTSYFQAGRSRASSELVTLASQLTKPNKVKRLFTLFTKICIPFDWFLKTPPEAPRGVDLKQESTNSIIITTNLISLTKAFKMDIIRQAVRMLFTVILNLFLNCLIVLSETDCRQTDYLCYEFSGGKHCCNIRLQNQFPRA